MAFTMASGISLLQGVELLGILAVVYVGLPSSDNEIFKLIGY